MTQRTEQGIGQGIEVLAEIGEALVGIFKNSKENELRTILSLLLWEIYSSIKKAKKNMNEESEVIAEAYEKIFRRYAITLDKIETELSEIQTKKIIEISDNILKEMDTENTTE